MMVTFVSECEKKALKRTRRVLDAFANRIGTRTWQTVITQEGLLTVKKLLKRSASKNTAVSCHWIRSRSRSDLIWVIGKRSKFSSEGYVPVNYTVATELLIDEIEIMTQSIFANTKGQRLSDHSFAVGLLAKLIIEKLVPQNSNLIAATYIAGTLHDIGKLDPKFQDWVGKKKESPDSEEVGQHIPGKSSQFSFKKHPRHNEISLLLYYLLEDDSFKRINKANKKRIKHVLYWHHAKPIRGKEEFTSLDTVFSKLKKNIGKQEFKLLANSVHKIIDEINQIASGFDDLEKIEGLLVDYDSDKLDELDVRFPKYKRYSTKESIEEYTTLVGENALNALCRTAVISADRKISRLSPELLEWFICEKRFDKLVDEMFLLEGGLNIEIEKCLLGFGDRFPGSKRNVEQTRAAADLKKIGGVAVLNGPAGCGKTKIALEWALLTDAKKIIWVCPRVQVCQGLINDLTSEEYLANVKIEINTGEFKTIHYKGQETPTEEGKEFSGDIVITTIDQVINKITTHTHVTGLVQYMSAHVVFDEYHEYIHMPAFNLLFAELIECKNLRGENAKALLVSATPNYHFIKELLGIDRKDVVGISSFNESKYKIILQDHEEAEVDGNPLYQSQPRNTIVISNTAIAAQRSFILNQMEENAILLHSKYKRDDKRELFEKAFNAFKEKGNRKFDVLRSGPIIQASLNITCDKMITEFTSPENWLQRLGRLDRFGKNENENEYVTAIPQTIALGGKQIGSCAKFLAKLCVFESAKAWLEFLQENLPDNSVNINQIYEIYENFYQNSKCLDAVEQDLLKALKESVDRLDAKLVDPVSFPGRKLKKDQKVRIKKHSLRGNNRFVQMAVVQVRSLNEFDFVNKYAYESNDLDANLTYESESITGCNSDHDLRAYMFRKHHNVIERYKKPYEDKVLSIDARNPESPIYLSYTPQDLKKVGGESQRHEYAIYYAMGLKQPIGSISITKLKR